MATKQNFRARVMKYAWQILRATKMAWSYCLRKAWMLYKLWNNMKKGNVRFTYFKTNGSLRHAIGTLKFRWNDVAVKKGTKPAYKTMKYYDLDRKSFRCFKVENLVTVELC